MKQEPSTLGKLHRVRSLVRGPGAKGHRLLSIAWARGGGFGVWPAGQESFVGTSSASISCSGVKGMCATREC